MNSQIIFHAQALLEARCTAASVIHVFIATPAFATADGSTDRNRNWAVAGLSSVLGVQLAGSVDGGYMLVCITVLNSYSGLWTFVPRGFPGPTFTDVGCLIRFSGAILTKIMCDVMNRDIFNVIFSATVGTRSGGGDERAK